MKRVYFRVIILHSIMRKI